MSNEAKFKWKLESSRSESKADPPQDPLGELSHFELGLRHFCYECNYPISIEIGDEKRQVFLDPDICLVLEDGFPGKIGDLFHHQPIELEFTESCCIVIELVPNTNTINCKLKEFGYLSGRDFTLNYREKYFELNFIKVLEELKRFVSQILQMAVESGYITPEEKQEFLMPIDKIVSPAVLF